MKLFICLFILILPFRTVSASTLILEEIQKSIIKDYKLEGKIKLINPEERPLPPTPVIESKKSKGENAIQDQLRQNREKLKAMREAEQQAPISGNNWIDEKQKNINEWQKNKIQEIKSWQLEKQETINNWIIEKSKFNERIQDYKENLIEEKDFKVSALNQNSTQNSKQENKKFTTTKLPIFPDYFVIDKALDVEIKDQGQRPTCAAFSGIHAIEILMAQKGASDKLSEQFFFWASLPNCQESKCKKEGSWVYTAFKNSQNSKSFDIPFEKDCAYNKSPIDDNVTQIPLSNSCQNGVVKIKNFSEVKSNAEIISAIKSGHPVIGGFKLSENFYKNNGYVFQKQSQTISEKLDSHAAGHAIVLVGIMKLPDELRTDEGSYCLISANSWGQGWGKGGHACLSEKWIDKHRFDVNFISLDEIYFRQ